MDRLPKLLLLAALLLVCIGAVVALVQPFGIGDEEAGTETAQQEETETETETSAGLTTTTTTTEAGEDVDGPMSTTAPAPDTTPTTGAAAPGDDAPDGTTSTTAGGSAAPSTTAVPAPTTTTVASGPVGGDGGGSGLDGETATPADLEDGLADTGGTSAVGIALLAGLAGLALRRRTT